MFIITHKKSQLQTIIKNIEISLKKKKKSMNIKQSSLTKSQNCHKIYSISTIRFGTSKYI